MKQEPANHRFVMGVEWLAVLVGAPFFFLWGATSPAALVLAWAGIRVRSKPLLASEAIPTILAVLVGLVGSYLWAIAVAWTAIGDPVSDVAPSPFLAAAVAGGGVIAAWLAYLFARSLRRRSTMNGPAVLTKWTKLAGIVTTAVVAFGLAGTFVWQATRPAPLPGALVWRAHEDFAQGYGDGVDATDACESRKDAASHGRLRRVGAVGSLDQMPPHAYVDFDDAHPVVARGLGLPVFALFLSPWRDPASLYIERSPTCFVEYRSSGV